MTALYTHAAGLAHLMPEGHPEQVARLAAVRSALAAEGLTETEPPVATREDLMLAHPAAFVDAVIAATPEEGLVAVDGDTFISPGRVEAARRAVGGAIAAVDAVLDGGATNAFVAMRPPGHHAEATRAMGFCLFSTVAIAALHAMRRRGLARVAVVDFDVHHGNGTQDVLWNEAGVLFASSHQMPLFPGTGAPHERGAHGQILNAPLGPGTDGATMRSVYDTRILPRIDAFAPDLILVSAGFDAHAADPLANLAWRTEDFAWLTRRLCALAGTHCGGRLVSSLEGGYDLDALAEAAAAHVRVLQDHA